MKSIIVAIDGFSSCGKSTLAKDLAKEVGYIHIDTGAMYRATTLHALQKGYIRNNVINEAALQAAIHHIHISFAKDAATGKQQVYLNGQCVEQEVRGMDVSTHVSAVSALPFVRTAMVHLQREMGKAKGVVLDGRDIGTVVFPDAELKIFVTAEPEIRAQRRYDELVAKGVACSYEEILENVKNRDLADTTRAISPLRQAKDAIVLDNSHISITEQKQWLLDAFRRVVDED